MAQLVRKKKVRFRGLGKAHDQIIDWMNCMKEGRYEASTSILQRSTYRNQKPKKSKRMDICDLPIWDNIDHWRSMVGPIISTLWIAETWPTQDIRKP